MVNDQKIDDTVFLYSFQCVRLFGQYLSFGAGAGWGGDNINVLFFGLAQDVVVISIASLTLHL